MTPTHIILHHSGTVDTNTLTWGILRKNHQAVYEGAEHPYHYGIELVRDSYEILLGRMPDLKGAHCRSQGMNRMSIGVCLVGDFDKNTVPLNQLTKAQELVRYLIRKHHIPNIGVLGHREVKTTSCPGRFFDLGTFRSSL